MTFGAGRNVLVTGATGFVGSALAARLAAEGASVIALSRRAPDSTPKGVTWITGDLEDAARVNEVMHGVDAVFHVGGAVGHFGSREEYLRANVGGTRNVIDACRNNGIEALVFTSTPSVIADGTGHFDVDESAPYSRKFESPYPESKALAEQLVRAANGKGLRTVCVRPHMIWGSGSSHWVRGLRRLAGKGLLYQIGDGRNRVGMTFIDDCIDAHLAALQAVEADAAVGGQAFFVHSGYPVRLWDWVQKMTAALGLPEPRGRLPGNALHGAAKVCDSLVRLSRGRLHFPISAYLITELTTDHYSRIDRARAWLSFSPKVSLAEGITRMAQHGRLARPEDYAPSPEPSLSA